MNNELKDLFTPYQEALELKELGFDKECLYNYIYNPMTYKIGSDDNIPTLRLGASFHQGLTPQSIPTPTYSQAFRWFREKYNLRGFIGFRPNVKMFDYHIYDMSLSGLEYTKQRTMEEFNKDPKVGTYEEAELECLKKLIEIVKNK